VPGFEPAKASCTVQLHDYVRQPGTGQSPPHE